MANKNPVRGVRGNSVFYIYFYLREIICSTSFYQPSQGQAAHFPKLVSEQQ